MTVVEEEKGTGIFSKMTFDRYISNRINWGLILAAQGTILLGASIVVALPIPERLFLGLMGVILGFGSIYLLRRGLGLRQMLRGCTAKQHGIAKMTVPGSSEIRMEMAGQDSCLIVFFQNVSPDLLTGKIQVSVGGSPFMTLDLTEQKPHYISNSKPMWRRDIGKKQFPLFLPFKINKSAPELAVSLDFRWNFKGEYLETLIPPDRSVIVESWLSSRVATK